MKNSIAQRIADFLKDFPPFDGLSTNECYQLATQIEVIYLRQQKKLFNQNEKTHRFFYVVHQGLVNLHLRQDNSWRLVDVCDEGDLLGLRPFFAEQNYAMKATAKTDAMIYAVPFDAFQDYLKRDVIAHFLLRSFTSNQRQPFDKDDKGVLISNDLAPDNPTQPPIDFFQKINYTADPFCVSVSDSIKQVAEKMTKLSISSALVASQDKPIGIVTDKDLRKNVATGKIDYRERIDTIMSSPVLCLEEMTSVAKAQLIMLRHHVGHLCITADGSANSKIIGILSEHDIITAQATNPAAILKGVERAKKVEGLKKSRAQLTQLLKSYIQSDLPIAHCLALTEGIHQSMYQVCANLCISEMPRELPCKFAWLNLGSQARNEQLLLTDQDHAMVFEDVPADQYESVKAYFLQLGEKMSQALAKIGFELCPADMMASNPDYCLSLKEWKDQFKKWIKSPVNKRIMLCSIFFDFSIIYGDSGLEKDLSNYVFHLLRGDQTFFAYLAADALKNPPPLSFFKQFVVEDDGAHKDEFDLKARAIMPLIDAARVLALSNEISGCNGTVERFKQLAKIEPQNADLYEQCISRFYDLLRFRTDSGFANDTSGRFVNLAKLSKQDKNQLKYTFKPIKSLQSNLKTRFNLAYFQ